MTTPEPVETSSAAATPPRWYRQPALLIAVVAAALLAVQWYDSHQQMKTLQGELARRIDAEGRESRNATDQVRDSTREAQAKLEVLEAKQHESQNQHAALEGMYQELARSRDENLLSDVEQTLLIANQQIQAAGNVRAALIAAQSIDARLARLDRPQLQTLRKVVAADIERLKKAPRIDIPAIAAQLDELAAGIDALPLLVEARPSDVPAARKAPVVAEENPWLRFAREFWHDVRELVRIEKIDNADAAPLSVSQAFFLRENLRLRLLGARVALLAHNEKSYKADLKAARDWLARYFDTRREPVNGAVTALRQLQENGSGIDLPDLTPSLDAVRALRATIERR